MRNRWGGFNPPKPSGNSNTGSRSFKVIDFDQSKKLVTSACYDKQHKPICTYLQPFSHYKSQ